MDRHEAIETIEDALPMGDMYEEAVGVIRQQLAAAPAWCAAAPAWCPAADVSRPGDYFIWRPKRDGIDEDEPKRAITIRLPYTIGGRPTDIAKFWDGWLFYGPIPRFIPPLPPTLQPSTDDGDPPDPTEKGA